MAQLCEERHLMMSFPVALVQAARASIRRCSSEDWTASLDRVLEAFFRMVWVPL